MQKAKKAFLLLLTLGLFAFSGALAGCGGDVNYPDYKNPANGGSISGAYDGKYIVSVVSIGSLGLGGDLANSPTPGMQHTVVTGVAQYPENIMEGLEKEHTVYRIDAMEEAKKLGNSKVFNIIVLGMAARHMDFSEQAWLEVIEKTVPPKTVDINKKAFLAVYRS